MVQMMILYTITNAWIILIVKPFPSHFPKDSLMSDSASLHSYEANQENENFNQEEAIIALCFIL